MISSTTILKENAKISPFLDLEQFGRDITIKSFDNFAQKTDKTIY